jgi:hypothetical protein
MKTIKYFLLLISLTILFSSCGKEGLFNNTKVYGKATDKTTGSSISGLQISLYIGTGTGTPSRFDHLKDINTNSDGTYEIDFSATSGNTYYLYINDGKYHGEYTGIKKRDKTEANFNL